MKTGAALAAALAVLSAMSLAPPVFAQTTGKCTGFVEQLPAVLEKSGRWCLRRNLVVNLDSGPALRIRSGAVTLDCRGFSIRGRIGDRTTQTTGIEASGGSPVIRDCVVRGFRDGIDARYSSARIEDNRIEDVTRYGITSINGGLFRRNRLRTIGGAADSLAVGIQGGRFVIGNTVEDVDGRVNAIGINGGAIITGNRVRRVVARTGYAAGVSTYGNALVADNHLIGAEFAIRCGSAGPDGVIRDNAIAGGVLGPMCLDRGQITLP
jgi:hypothetical protein